MVAIWYDWSTGQACDIDYGRRKPVRMLMPCTWNSHRERIHRSVTYGKEAALAGMEFDELGSSKKTTER